jgi:DNA-binding beta-propeller fold protein YncE
VIAAVLLAAAALPPQTILTIDPKHRLVEGVASDGRTIWISSILDRTVLACRKTCRTMAVLPTGLHPFAIAWDRGRKRLWVAADCPPGVRGITPCDRGALIALDKSGRIVTRISPDVGTFHPGDVSASQGQVFVSDSQNGMVFRLTSSSRAIMAVVLPGVGKSGQGTALSEDGKSLLVADYSQGIGSVDLATWTRTLLPRQDGKPLRGVDGLVRCRSTYYGIYNGAAPGALVSINLTGQGIKFDQPLGDATLPDPTQIAFDGKRLLIVADSGWATLDKADFVRTQGAPIVAVPLSKDCQPK